MKIRAKQITELPGSTKVDKQKVSGPTSYNYHMTGLTITRTPRTDSDVEVQINGISQRVGDYDITKDCFFQTGIIYTHVNCGGTSGASGPTLTRRNDFTVWAWGQNNVGQLGDDTVADRSSPVSVVGTHSFALIAAGGSNLMALKPDGTAWAWGQNTSGQIGDNTTVNKSSPVSIVGTHSFIQIEAGTSRTGGLKANGSVWMWGGNVAAGNLGDDTNVDKSSPVSVVGTHSFIKLVVNTHSIGLKSDGTAWAWGLGTSGQLGQGTVAVNRSSPVSVIGNHSFVENGVGSFHSVGRKADGTAWCWGLTSSGQLGQDSPNARSSPVSVVGTHSFIKIAVSNDGEHTLGLKADGSCWAWGSDSFGQLGDNNTNNRSSPVSVVGGHSFIDITGGSRYSGGFKADGSVWAWGTNTSGALGDNTVTDRSSPVLTIGQAGSPRSIADITAGDRFIWNGVNGEFNLDANDVVDFRYIDSTDPE
jgi:alpha-tubulin suppressor-like RCC1 family protein